MNTEGYKEMMAELQTEYLASFDDKFSQMKDFFKNQDWNSLELEFHKLKGTGATYGAPEVTELCQWMEDHCHQHTVITEDTLITAMELLQKIREKYSNSKNFELQSDAQYLALKNRGTS